jgi:formate hydrogenlyase subunit 6/NADH:ubiquinone oxidoreductase subunit I
MSTLSENNIRIYVMGSAYEVPRGLTIMDAMEHAGWRFIRGAGCRSGFCGACSTVYRQEGDYRLRFTLACQTEAEDGMYLVQLPFTPAPRVSYILAELNPDENVLLQHYPEIARCVSCNTCTKACPQDIEVMDYVQAALRGDIAQTAILSFDCIQCGLCSMRCPADIKHYHMAQMARRIYGRYMSPITEHLKERIAEIAQGVYEEELSNLVQMKQSELEEIYTARVVE